MTDTATPVDAPAGRKLRTRTPEFPAHHKYDHNFFLFLVAMIWFGILMGFVPDIIHHIEHPVFPYPWIVFVHAVVFVGWLCLLTTQLLLVRFRNIALHRRLGKIGFYWAPLIPIVGLLTVIDVDRAMHQHFAAFKPNFVGVQFGDLVLFAIFTGAALALRKRPAAHKRLMLLGTICMVDAGFSRWWAGFFVQHFGRSFESGVLAMFLGNILLMLAIMVYDLMTRRRLHLLYAGAATFAIVAELGTVWLLVSPWWIPIAWKLIGY